MSKMAITADYDNMSFADLLAYKAQKQKDRVFVIDPAGEWTWGDIDRGSRIIANDLIKMGAGRGSHVALCALNSANWIMAFFAIQRIGGLALLINPIMLAGDIGTVAGVGDATHIICGRMTENRDDESFDRTICEIAHIETGHLYDICDVDFRERFDEIETVPEDQSERDAVMLPDDVCVMIFTSGSTGIPKGVLHSATNILSASWINCIDQRLGENDRTCLILPLFHIFGLVAGLFSNTVADGRIYIPENMHVRTLLELMDREKITVFHSVPTMLIALMQNDDFRPEKLESLRCSIISGAAATKAQMDMFKKTLPNDNFRSSYGLSEMAPVTISRYDDDEDHVRTTVGRPVRDIYIKIVDPVTGKECRQGESGEILVKGHRLMTAYYKLSVEDQALDGRGWLHTGDLGYITDDGYVCLSGRIKELIIRGGENIMPIAVENVISESEEIANVKVVGVPSEFYGEEVAACVIPKDPETFDPDGFKKSLRGKLARYMVPSFIEVYESFPLLASGKCDRIALSKDVTERVAGFAGTTK